MTYAQKHTLELPNQPRQKRIRQNRDQNVTVVTTPHNLGGSTRAAVLSLLGASLLHERALPGVAGARQRIVHCGVLCYRLPVSRLTRQEQLVLCIVLGLLLMGWAVKAYRTSHPPAQTVARP